MSASNARKDAEHGAKAASRCARCRKRLRSRGQLVPGTGIVCDRCAGKAKTA
jgi:DNA-directed RNA polymerase subunit RPC12/RpoP